MATAPRALAVSRLLLAVSITTYHRVRDPPYCTWCVLFYNSQFYRPEFGGNPIPIAPVPTSTTISNATALALHPATGAFICALLPVSASGSGLLCSGSAVPATTADRPPVDGSVPLKLLAATTDTVCVTLAGSGWLWCFSDAGAELVASAAAANFPTSVPSGADPARALMLQVNVTALAASEVLLCFIYANASAAGQLACVGQRTNAVLTTALAGAASAGFGGDLGLWAATRGGTMVVSQLVSVTVGNNHACILTANLRPWCWGSAAAAAAIAATNADTSLYVAVAAGGRSTCAFGVDGRLRCFGGWLDAFIQDGAIAPPAYGNVTAATAAAATTLPPLVSAGSVIVVNASSGDDSSCTCGSAATACSTLSGAIAAAARCLASATMEAAASMSIRISGRVDAVPGGAAANASSLPLSSLSAYSLLLLHIGGVAGTDATIVFSSCSPACLTMPSGAVPRLMLEGLTLAPSSWATPVTSTWQQPCVSVLSSSAQTWLTSVTLAGWNCSGSHIYLSAPLGLTQSAFAAARTNAATGRLGDTAVFAGASFSEIAQLRFVDCTGGAGVLAQALPALQVDELVAERSLFASALLVDQALQAVVSGVRLVAPLPLPELASSAVPLLQPVNGDAMDCGAAVRVNNVGLARISNVAASKLRLAGRYGGGTVCLTDVVTVTTLSEAPRATLVTVDGIYVDDCAIGNSTTNSTAGTQLGNGGGCAIRALLLRPLPSASLSITRVQVTQSFVLGDGAAILVQAPSASISNVSCLDTYAAGAAGGGCIAAQRFVSMSLAAVVTKRTAAAQAGGAVLLAPATAASSVSLLYSEFTDAVAAGGSGGAVSVQSASSIKIANVVCTRCSSPRGSGGCAALQPQARVDTRSNGVAIASLTARSCAAGVRGGAVAVDVDIVPGDASSLAVQRSVFVGNTAGGCGFGDGNAWAWLATAPAVSCSWWVNVCPSCAANQSTAAAGCKIPDEAGVGGGALAIVYSRGTLSDADVVGIASPRIALADALFQDNTAGAVGSSRGKGGAVMLARTDTARSLALVTMQRVGLFANTAGGGGGGLFLRSTQLSTWNMSIVNCTATAGDGGGLLAQDTSLAATPALTLAHNRAIAGSGGGAALLSCILDGALLLGDTRDLLAPSATPSPSVTMSASQTASVSSSSTTSASATLSSSRAASVSPASTPSRTASTTRAPSASMTPSASMNPSTTPSVPATPAPSLAPLPGADTFVAAAVSRWLAAGITFLNNSAAVSGGGLALISCDAVVGGAVLVGNVASEGGGLFATGSGALYLCSSILMMNAAIPQGGAGASTGNTAATVGIGSGSPAAASTFGGGLALLDLSRDAHLCDSAACGRFLLLTARDIRAQAGSTPRLPFAALLSVLMARANDAVRLLGEPPAVIRLPSFSVSRMSADALRLAIPPGPQDGSFSAAASGLFAAAAAAAATQVSASAAAAASGNSTARAAGVGDGATCAWASNAADGPGGDVSVRSASDAAAIAAGGRAALAFVSSALHYAGTSAAAGGSIYVANAPASLSSLDIVASVAGSPFACSNTNGSGAMLLDVSQCNITASSIDAGAGYGGAIALMRPVYAEIVGVRVVSAFARFGGGMWVQPFGGSSSSAVNGTALAVPTLNLQLPSVSVALLSLASQGTAVDVLPPALDGRLLVDGVVFSNVTSSAGAAGTFVQGAMSPITGCGSTCSGRLQELVGSVVDLPRLGGAPPRPQAFSAAAALPVNIFVMSTLQRPGDTGVMRLVSLVASSAPVAVLHLRDTFNLTASWDDSTVCTAAVRAGDGSSLSLMFPPQYQASAGVVVLAPFGIAAAPGAAGTLQVTCEVSLAGVAYSVRKDVAVVETARVRLLLSAVAAPPPEASGFGAANASAADAATAPFCNDLQGGANASAVNSIARPPPSTPIRLPVLLPSVSGARPWQPDWYLRLSLVDATEAAVVPPASLPCSVALASAVDMVTGSPVSASLLAYSGIAATSVDLVGLSADVPIAVARAAGAIVNITASCRWVSGEAVSAVAPLTVHTAALQLGWVVGVLAQAASTQPSSQQPSQPGVGCSQYTLRCSRQAASCPLTFGGLQAASSAATFVGSLATWGASLAWPLNVSTASLDPITAVAAPGLEERDVPGLIGVAAETLNLASWGRGVLVIAPLPLPLPAARALSLDKEQATPLANESAWAATIAETAVAGVAPAALPSSTDGTQLLPLTPAPTLVLLARHASFPAPLAFMAGSGLCSATMVAAAALGSTTSSLPSQAAVVGTTAAAMADGLSSLAAVGLTGLPFGSEAAARLRVQCTLSGNEAQLSATLPIRVPAIRSTLVSTVPPLFPPSSSSSLAPLRAPLVHAFTVEPAGSNASAASSGSDFNATQQVLGDASLASELRAIGARLVCTLQCSSTTAPGQPCALEGRTVAAMDLSATGPVAAATVTFGAFGLSSLASYPNSSCINSQCTWLDGQKLVTEPVCVAQPAALIAWCDANSSSLAAAARCNVTDAGAAFPDVAAPNEPLQPFAVVVVTSPANGLAELGLSADSGSSTLRCSLEAVASAVVAGGSGGVSVVALGSMPVRGGADAAADLRSGLAVFRGAALALSASQAAMLQQVGSLTATVWVACTLNERPFGVSASRSVRIPRLKATWVNRPPAVIAPATATLAQPFSPPVALSLADAVDPAFVVDVAATCSLEIAARWLPPDSVSEGAAAGAWAINASSMQPAAAAFALLTGGTQRPLVRGYVSFPDVGLAGSMGASVLLRAACRRDEGGEVASSEWNVSIAQAAVSWPVADAPPQLILSGRPFTAAFGISWRVIPPAVAAARDWQWRYDASGGADGIASVLEPVGQLLPAALAVDAAATRVQCVMALADVSSATAAAQTDVIQFTPVATTSNETAGDDGQPRRLTVLLDVSGPAGRIARFQPVCSVGGHTFRAAARRSTLAAVGIVPLQPLPKVWLCSDGSAVNYVDPPPQLALAAEDGSSPDTRGAVCTSSVVAAFGRGAGNSILSVTSANSTATAVLSNALNVSMLAAQWPPSTTASLINAPSSGYFNDPSATSQAPVSIGTLAIRAAFGDWVLLRLSCSRANKDPTLPLDVPIRIARMAALWMQQPPAEAFPGGIFNASIVLFDADGTAWPGVGAEGNASFASLSPASVLANRVFDAFAHDDVSSCTLVPLSVTDSAGRSLDVGKVVVQGGSAIARAGVLGLPAAAVTARVGTLVRGRVKCSTGSLTAADATLTWSIAMTSCPRGSAPVGDGANCVNCGRQYSDGGPGATQCTSCPTVGANCAGGVLTLLPGFFRADSNPTIDENTELHPCGLPFACWVNTSTTDRNASLTHGCNDGYLQGSPLCGVCAPGYARTGKECGRCPPPAFNWFVTSLMPAGILGFGAWAAQRSINEASPFAPLTRIALGHIQLLGTLMGAFVAQATATVRETLNFAEVAGSSPLAVAPVHCALGGISFYVRFMATLALAPVLMMATIGAQAALSCRKRWLLQQTQRRAGLRSRAERHGHGGTKQRAALAGAKSFSLVPSFRGVINPLASSSAISRTGIIEPELEEPTPASTANATRTTAASGSTKSCLALRRLADDPRIVGPAVFVLVSHSMDCGSWMALSQSHHCIHCSLEQLICLPSGTFLLLRLLCSPLLPAELLLPHPHHGRLQRLQLHASTHRWRAVPEPRPLHRLRHAHARIHEGARRSSHRHRRLRDSAAAGRDAAPPSGALAHASDVRLSRLPLRRAGRARREICL